MIKSISNTLLTAFKLGSVIVATAVVVVSIQASAEGDKQQGNQLSIQQPWTPSAGFADLIEQVSPAVVHVAVSGTRRSDRRAPQFNFPPGSPFEDFFENFRDRQQPNRSEPERPRPLGIGSGFIISADGYVVTNNHVIQGADEIVVTMTDGEEYEAELKGTDDKTDLALLKLKNAKNLPYVGWGDAEKSRVGDWVLAIGNPFGLGGSASTGIISARGRDINSGPYDDYFQVDAAINRGNSGGPLFNLQGEVIGINTAIYSPNGGSVGIGFSIPSSTAQNVIAQLRDSGEVERAFIGVEIQQVTDELAEGFGLKNDHGALVSRVRPDQPADKAGVKRGDIILSFDGKEIKEMRDLPRIVAQSPVGKSTKMDVWRGGKKKTLTIKSERFEDDSLAETDSRAEPDEVELGEEFGATLRSLTDEARERYNFGEGVEGVIVMNVKRGGLASSNDIRSGDILIEVDGNKVSTPEDVVKALKNARDDKRKSIVIFLQRNSANRFIPFDLFE